MMRSGDANPPALDRVDAVEDRDDGLAPMELIVAMPELARPGGRQAYALTVAEHLSRLGHRVTLFARELGAIADVARERGLNVTGRLGDLPAHADGAIAGVDPSLAIELAQRYPQAARVFVARAIDELHPPPPAGVIAATVALNDRLAASASACAGAGEVVRLREPVDMTRFGVRGEPAERPRRALLLGDDLGVPGARAQLLEDAWSQAGIEWAQMRSPEPGQELAEALHEVDVVVGGGRAIVEAMASGRPAYVFGRAGAGGWVTPRSYKRIEAAGFCAMSDAPPPDAARLRDELAEYRPELGRLGHDLVRAHHDARRHAAELVALLRRLIAVAAPAQNFAPLPSEAQVRPEKGDDRQEIEQWLERAQAISDHLGAMRGELASTKAALGDATAQMHAMRESRGFRLAQALGKLADRLRRAGGRSS